MRRAELTENSQSQNPAAASDGTAAAVVWLQTRAILRLIFTVGIVAGLLWVLYQLRHVALLIVLAILFAYLLAPLVEFLHRSAIWPGRGRQMPRAAAVGVAYLFVFGSLGLALYLLLPRLGSQAVELSKQAPAYFANARARTQWLTQWYERSQLPAGARDAISRIGSRTAEAAETYFSAALSQVAGWLTALPSLVLIPVLAFFFLNESETLRRAALQALPRGALRWHGNELFADINRTLATYIRGQLIACLIIGAVCLVGFELLRIPYAMVLAIAAGFLEFIPLLGPFLILVAATLLAGFVSLSKGVEVAAFLLVLRGLEDYVIYPRIIGGGIHLHPLTVILAVLCGGELGGVAGIFLSIPAVAVLAVAYRHWLRFRGSEGLVADLLRPANHHSPPQEIGEQPGPVEECK